MLWVGNIMTPGLGIEVGGKQTIFLRGQQKIPISPDWLARWLKHWLISIAMAGILLNKIIKLNLVEGENTLSLKMSMCDMFCSPPVRWGLLDFMSALTSSFAFSSSAAASSSSFVSSSVSSCDPVCSVFRAGPQPRACEASVPRRTSTAILWGQCSAPDLKRDPVCSVFRAGPQPRACEASVPRRTSTASLWGQCSAPDLNRDPVRPVFRAGPQPRNVSERRMPERMSKDMSERKSERLSEDMSERMSKDMSERMSERLSERMSKDMSERMSEDCFQSVCEVESNRTHFRRWVVCLPSPDPIRLT